MEFVIKAGATMPYLTLELVEDGLSTYMSVYEKLQNATATFSMIGLEGCAKKVVCRPMEIVDDACDECSTCKSKLKLLYKWRPQDTNTKGIYKGEISIDFLDGCGKLIVPIREDLFIIIK